MAIFPENLAELARGTKGFMPTKEGLALFDLASAIQSTVPGPIVEIGSYCGLSTIYLGEAARQTGRSMLTVDHHRGSEEMHPPSPFFDQSVIDPVTKRVDTLPFLRRTLELSELESVVTVAIGDSAVVAGLVADPIACLFIDGGHGALQEWVDYASWADKITVGGLLLIHDVFEDEKDGGRPPFEIYTAAVASKQFATFTKDTGSLRALRRVG